MWDQYKMNRPGLAGILGSLERQIMLIVWELGEATVTEVQERLEAPSSYETIKTVMARLASEEKALLVREMEKRAYIYRPTISRAELEAQVSRRMLDSVLSGFGSTALSQFAELLKEKPEQREELRALLNQIVSK